MYSHRQPDWMLVVLPIARKFIQLLIAFFALFK